MPSRVVVFGLLVAGTITQFLLARFASRRVMMAGLSLFLAGLALIVAALSQADLALFLAGTVVGGVAVGAVFLGKPGYGQSPGPARAARSGHLELLRAVL
jgi:MFS family permease